MPKLSAVVLAHNEERDLADCLENLNFVDELVVVLDKCTDNSKEIALRYTSHIIEGRWDIEGERHRVGIEACSGDWILELDVDERIPPALVEEIQAFLPTAEYGYAVIPFDNYIDGRLVKYGWGCSWGVGAAIRLFAKGAKVWGPQRVHPKLTLSGKRYLLKNAIIHHVFDGVADMIARFNTYSSKRAQDMFDNCPPGENTRHNLRRILSRFYKCYFRRKGYREGVYGFLNALFAGLYPLISYLKYRELVLHQERQKARTP